MAFSIHSKPPPPVQQSSVAQQPAAPAAAPAAAAVNKNDGNFEDAVKNDANWGGRGGLGGEVGVDQYVDQTKASGGVILNPDDLFA